MEGILIWVNSEEFTPLILSTNDPRPTKSLHVAWWAEFDDEKPCRALENRDQELRPLQTKWPHTKASFNLFWRTVGFSAWSLPTQKIQEESSSPDPTLSFPVQAPGQPGLSEILLMLGWPVRLLSVGKWVSERHLVSLRTGDGEMWRQTFGGKRGLGGNGRQLFTQCG